MQIFSEQSLPDLPSDLASRDGVRNAVKRLHAFLKDYLHRQSLVQTSLAREITPLYGEFDYTPAEIVDGAQAIVTIAVDDAILGYTCEVSYDQDLEELQMSSYVLDGSVKVVLKNDTGAPVTLTAGRFRAYVWPRQLT